MSGSIFLFLNLGGGEIFIVVLVIILLFGSDQLPQLVKSVGRGIREINDAKNQIQNEIQKGAGLSNDIEKQASEIKEEITQVQQTVKRQMNSVLENNETKS
jgi:sec-independent protein translocase protein TatA